MRQAVEDLIHFASTFDRVIKFYYQLLKGG